jgi:hypothetical protein
LLGLELATQKLPYFRINNHIARLQLAVQMQPRKGLDSTERDVQLTVRKRPIAPQVDER